MKKKINIGSFKVVSPKVNSNLSKSIEVLETTKELSVLLKNNESFSNIFKVLGLKEISIVLDLISMLIKKKENYDEIADFYKKIINVSLIILKQGTEYIDLSEEFVGDYLFFAKKLRLEVGIKEWIGVDLEIRKNVDKTVKNTLISGITINNDRKNELFEKLTDITDNILKYLDILDSEVNAGKNFQPAITELQKSFNELFDFKLSKNIFVYSGLNILWLETLKHNPENAINDLKEILFSVKNEINHIVIQFDDLVGGDKTGNINLLNQNSIINLLLLIINAESLNTVKDIPVYESLLKFFEMDKLIEEVGFLSKRFSGDIHAPKIANFDKELVIKSLEDIVREITAYNESLGKMGGVNVEKVKNNTNDLIKILSRVSEEVSSYFVSLNRLITYMESLTDISKNIVIWIGVNAYFLELLKTEVYILGVDTSPSVINIFNQLTNKNLDIIAGDHDISNEDVPVLFGELKENENTIVIQKLFSVLSNEFQHVEDSMSKMIKFGTKDPDQFSEEKDEVDFENSQVIVNKIGMILSFVGLDVVVTILNDIKKTWQHMFRAGVISINKEDRDNSALWTGGISLFIKRISEGNFEIAESIINNIIDKYNTNKNQKFELVNTKDLIVDKSGVVIKEIIPAIKPVKEDIISTDNNKIVEDEERVVEEKELPINPIEVVQPKSLTVEKADKNNATIIRSFIEVTDGKESAEDYLYEIEEVLEQLNNDIPEYEAHPSNEKLTDIKRVFHTLKGSGRQAEFSAIPEVAWLLEQTLNKVIDGRLSIGTEKILELVEKAKENFSFWKEQLKNNSSVEVNFVDWVDLLFAVNKDLETSLINLKEYKMSNKEVQSMLDSLENEADSDEDIGKLLDEALEAGRSKHLNSTDKEVSAIDKNEEVEELSIDFNLLSNLIGDANRVFEENPLGNGNKLFSEENFQSFHLLEGALNHFPFPAMIKIVKGLGLLQKISTDKNIDSEFGDYDVLTHEEEKVYKDAFKKVLELVRNLTGIYDQHGEITELEIDEKKEIIDDLNSLEESIQDFLNENKLILTGLHQKLSAYDHSKNFRKNDNDEDRVLVEDNKPSTINENVGKADAGEPEDKHVTQVADTKPQMNVPESLSKDEIIELIESQNNEFLKNLQEQQVAFLENIQRAIISNFDDINERVDQKLESLSSSLNEMVSNLNNDKDDSFLQESMSSVHEKLNQIGNTQTESQAKIKNWLAILRKDLLNAHNSKKGFLGLFGKK